GCAARHRRALRRPSLPQRQRSPFRNRGTGTERGTRTHGLARLRLRPASIRELWLRLAGHYSSLPALRTGGDSLTLNCPNNERVQAVKKSRRVSPPAEDPGRGRSPGVMRYHDSVDKPLINQSAPLGGRTARSTS